MNLARALLSSRPRQRTTVLWNCILNLNYKSGSDVLEYILLLNIIITFEYILNIYNLSVQFW